MRKSLSNQKNYAFKLSAISCDESLKGAIKELKNSSVTILNHELNSYTLTSSGIKIYADSLVDSTDPALTIMRGPFHAFPILLGEKDASWNFSNISGLNDSVATASVSIAFLYSFIQLQTTREDILDAEFNKNPAQIFNEYLREYFSKEPEKFSEKMLKIKEHLENIRIGDQKLKNEFDEINFKYEITLNDKGKEEIAFYLYLKPNTAASKNLTISIKKTKFEKFGEWIRKPRPFLKHVEDAIYYPALFYWISWALVGIIIYKSTDFFIPINYTISYVLGVGIPLAYTILRYSKAIFIWINREFDFPKLGFWNKYVKPYFDDTLTFWQKILGLELFKNKKFSEFQKTVIAIATILPVIYGTVKWLLLTLTMPIIGAGFWCKSLFKKNEKNNEIYYLENLPSAKACKKYQNKYIFVRSSTLDSSGEDANSLLLNKQIQRSDEPQNMETSTLYYVDQDGNLFPMQIATMPDEIKQKLSLSKGESLIQEELLLGDALDWLNEEITKNRGHELKATAEIAEKFINITKRLALKTQYSNANTAADEKLEQAPAVEQPFLTGWFMPPEKTTFKERMRFGWLEFVAKFVRFEYMVWFLMVAVVYFTATLTGGVIDTSLADEVLSGILPLTVAILAVSFLHAIREFHIFSNEKNNYAKKNRGPDIYVVKKFNKEEYTDKKYFGSYVIACEAQTSDLVFYYVSPNEEIKKIDFEGKDALNEININRLKELANESSNPKNLGKPIQEFCTESQKQEFLPLIWNQLALNETHRNQSIFQQQLMQQNITCLKDKIAQQKANLSLLKLKLGEKAPQDPEILDATVLENIKNLKRKNRASFVMGDFLRNPYWTAIAVIGLYFINSIYIGRLFFLDGTGMITSLIKIFLPWVGSTPGIANPIAFAAILMYIGFHSFLGITKKIEDDKNALKKQQIELAPEQEIYLKEQLDVLKKHTKKLKILAQDGPAHQKTTISEKNIEEAYPDPDLLNFSEQRNWKNRAIYFIAGSSLTCLSSLFLIPLIPAFSSLLSLDLVLKIGLPILAVNIIPALKHYLLSTDKTLNNREKNIIFFLLVGVSLSFLFLVLLYALPLSNITNVAMGFSFIPAVCTAAFFSITFKQEKDDLSLAREFLIKNKVSVDTLLSKKNTNPALFQNADKEFLLNLSTLLLNAMNPKGEGGKIDATQWHTNHENNGEGVHENSEEMLRDFMRVQRFLEKIKNEEAITTKTREEINNIINGFKNSPLIEKPIVKNLKKTIFKNKEQFIETLSMIFLILVGFCIAYLPAAFNAPLSVSWPLDILPIGILFIRWVSETIANMSTKYKGSKPYQAIAAIFSLKVITSIVLMLLGVASLVAAFDFNFISGLYPAISEPYGIAILITASFIFLQAGLKYLTLIKPSLATHKLIFIPLKIFLFVDSVALLGIAISLPITSFLMASGMLEDLFAPSFSPTLGSITLLAALPISFFIFKVLLPNLHTAYKTNEQNDQGKIANQEKNSENFWKYIGYCLYSLISLLAIALVSIAVMVSPNLLPSPAFLLEIAVVWGTSLLAVGVVSFVYERCKKSETRVEVEVEVEESSQGAIDLRSPAPTPEKQNLGGTRSTNPDTRHHCPDCANLGAPIPHAAVLALTQGTSILHKPSAPSSSFRPNKQDKENEGRPLSLVHEN